MTLLFLCQNLGLRLTGAAGAALIMAGGFPVLAGLLGIAVLGERLTRSIGTAALVSLVGVALVVLASGLPHTGAIGGDLLVLGSAASAAVYTVAGRRAFAPGQSARLPRRQHRLRRALSAPGRGSRACDHQRFGPPFKA